MALTVEDGTGLAAAESYASAAEAIAYLDAHAASGSSNVFTAASTPDQEIALRAATDYLDGNYSSRWLGYRANQVQALDWPRSDVTDIDGYAIASTTVPQRLKDATAELALRFIATSSGHDTQRLQPDQTPPVGQVTVKRTKAGPVETETRFASGGDQQTRYTFLARMLQRLINPVGGVALG